MTDLRKAAEMALDALENPWKAKPEGVADAIQALRQALQLTNTVQRWSSPDYYTASCQPNIPVNTSGIADLDSYRGVTYTTPLGAAIYDVDVVKWLIDNRSADYFKSKEWQDKCARSNHE